MADGNILEKMGIQTAAVITDAFHLTARAMARRNGFTDYRYATLPHPISSLNAEQIRERAAAAIPEILAILGIEEAAAGSTG